MHGVQADSRRFLGDAAKPPTVRQNSGRGPGYPGRRRQKERPGLRRALPLLPALVRNSVLDVQLGAAVLRTAFRIVRTIRVGVRSDRTALAVAGRADQARSVDAVAGQVVIDRLGATLGQLLVVGVGTPGVGVAGDFDAQIRIATQDLGGLGQDRDGVRTQGGLVVVEVHALQVDRDRDRAAVRTDGLAGLRTRALVVAVVDAVAVVIQVGAARGDRSRGRRRGGDRSRAQRDHDADRSQQVAEPVLVVAGAGRVDALVIEVGAVGQLGTQGDTVVEGGLQADADLGGQVAVATLAQDRTRDRILLLGVLVADAEQQVRVPATAFLHEVAAEIQRGAVLAPVQVAV